MINKHYDFVIRKPHEAAKRLEELEAQLNAAIDWHWNEAVSGTTRQDIVDNIKLLAEKI
jgi:hypothetical protein